MRSLILLSVLAASTAFAFRPGAGRAPVAPAPAPAQPSKLQTGHLDFETMNVTGNTLKNGAVQLRDRKLLQNKSMVKTPDNFRQALYDER
ncbi:MAG: hypothetical protein QM723_29645 [Myxococcaceae bacterium]